MNVTISISGQDAEDTIAAYEAQYGDMPESLTEEGVESEERLTGEDLVKAVLIKNLQECVAVWRRGKIAAEISEKTADIQPVEVN